MGAASLGRKWSGKNTLKTNHDNKIPKTEDNTRARTNTSVSLVEQNTVWCREIELLLFEVQSGEQKILTFTSKLVEYTACVPAGSVRLFHSADPSRLRALIDLSEIL